MFSPEKGVSEWFLILTFVLFMAGCIARYLLLRDVAEGGDNDERD